MKPLFYCLVVTICFSNVFAQKDTSSLYLKKNHLKPNYRQHEINVGFTNFLNNRYSLLEEIYFLENYDGYYPDNISYIELIGLNSTRYGIGYKYHLNNGSIRSYIDFGINNNSNKNNGNGGNTYNPTKTITDYSWSSELITCRLGYEFIINHNRTDFFYGIDAVYQYSNWKYKYRRETTTTQSENYVYTTTNDQDSKAKYQAYGAGLFIGIRYHISDMISIATETRMDVLGYQQKGSSESKSTTQPQSYNGTSPLYNDFSSSGIRTKIAPLGLISLNVHL